LAHGLLELRDSRRARTGLRRYNANKDGGSDQGSTRFHDLACVLL
jgi:hypothetical protein